LLAQLKTLDDAGGRFTFGAIAILVRGFADQFDDAKAFELGASRERRYRSRRRRPCGSAGNALAAAFAEFRAVVVLSAAFGTGNHPSALSKLQFSSAQNNFVVIFQLIKLVAPEASASGNISAVETAEVANEVIGPAANDLGMTARHAIDATLEARQIDIDRIGGIERSSNNDAAGVERKARALGEGFESRTDCGIWRVVRVTIARGRLRRRRVERGMDARRDRTAGA